MRKRADGQIVSRRKTIVNDSPETPDEEGPCPSRPFPAICQCRKMFRLQIYLGDSAADASQSQSVGLGLSENYIYVVSFIMKVLFLLVVLAASVLAQVVQ